MIEVNQDEGLTNFFTTLKDRSTLCAMDGIDFTGQEGEVLGFQVPNDARKASTIRKLIGSRSPQRERRVPTERKVWVKL